MQGSDFWRGRSPFFPRDFMATRAWLSGRQRSEARGGLPVDRFVGQGRKWPSSLPFIVHPGLKGGCAAESSSVSRRKRSWIGSTAGYMPFNVRFWLRWPFAAAPGLPLAAVSELPVKAASRCRTRASRVGFSGCGARPQLPRGTWNLPELGIKPVPSALAEGPLTFGPPGKTYACVSVPKREVIRRDTVDWRKRS